MEHDEDIEHEERGIYLVLVGAMIPIVFGTLLAHDVFDAGSTISLGLVMLGIFGLVSHALLRKRERMPQARTHTRH